MSAVPLVYPFPVANGSYHVNLHFAEISGRFEQVGARVFNVKIQGTVVFKNLDIYAIAGSNLALIEGADIPVNSGFLTIEFENLVGYAKVDAIEILPLASSAPLLSLRFVYPDGTPVAGTLAYTISSSLLSFNGSVPLSNGQASCVLLTSPSELGINAQFQVSLNLTDTAGHMLWRLILGMNPSEVNLGAIQTSSGSVDILATSLKFERTIDRQRGFLWRQEVRWPKSDSCLLPASLCKSPGRCSRATEAVSANVNLPSRSCWPFSA